MGLDDLKKAVHDLKEHNDKVEASQRLTRISGEYSNEELQKALREWRKKMKQTVK